MKRNGLVFVPREPPKRVILYPTQESASQQPNGLNARAKTAIVTNTHNETAQQPTNNTRLSRQAPLSSPPNSTSKLTEKPDNNGTVPIVTGQQVSLNFGQKVQNPYYSNPFFRPKIVTNQQATANTIPSPPSRDSSIVTTNITMQTLTSSSTTIPNRTRQPTYPNTQNPLLLSNGRTQDSETTVTTSPTQDDSRRWAHSIASAPIARRTVSDERPNGIVKPPETNITNTTNNDLLKSKGASATDIVISLMDTWRAPLNPGSSSAVNVYTRNGGIRDDSAISGQITTTTTTGDQLPATPPFLSVGTSSTASNNNQNWKKALVANFQKNSRNNPTAKLFNSKQTTVPIPVPISLNNDSTMNQQQKNERLIVFNGMNNERTFQVNENTLTIPLIRKSTESLRVPKQDNTSNIERSTSLQIQASAYSNPITTNAANKTEEIIKSTEASNSENLAHLPISIPSALITTKPPANVEQQRAIITRVMIRRDFVKSAEAKPPMPTAANFRSFIPPQSAKPGGLPQSNIIQVATITENNTATNSIVNSNRSYPQQQQLQTMPLSQKSLLSFTSLNHTVRESIKVENNQQQLNGITNEGVISTSITKTQQSQIVTNNGAAFRSSSLSAANAESRRKKEEMNINKAKKRANSASAVSTDGILDKDAFEMEDEEYEAELEEESLRSSESDVETDNTVTLDPAALLSGKIRRVGNAEIRSGFIPSLFSNVPPAIRFCTENQRIEQLPLPLRKMMKWKMSTITPNIVKNTVIRSGFRLISGDEGNDWLGTWSRHMKPICFKSIREYQKVNHFPGSFQIGRKDRLWRNLSHMQAVHSRREFDFVPQTFVLPADFLLFKRVFDELTDTKESKWIIKPPASARGQGIRVISKMEHVPKKRPVIVQKYIANPYLINGHKFDLRLYVYVTSHDPLRIYLFDDGLARFASRKYSSSVKSLSDRFMHLTNYSINRYNSEYRTNNDSAACTGHKWSLKALWTYLKKRDVDVADIMERIKDLIVKTIISADAYINVLTKANVRRKFSVHELFGFDVILDEQCKPYIVEVNISPSLHSNSPLDISVKGAMISDLFNLSGFMIPDRRDILSEGSARRKPKLPKSLIFDRRFLPQGLSTDEKIKHQHFAQRYHDEQARRNILDVLTPDDLRILIETEDEFARRGSFERIFPTNQTRKYLKFFETPRYFNLLLNEWIAKYNRMEERGIALLNTYCKKGIHLQHPAVDTNHMWTQYQKLQGHLSHRENDNTNGS